MNADQAIPRRHPGFFKPPSDGFDRLRLVVQFHMKTILPETKRAGEFEVIFNRMLPRIEADRLKSLDMVIAAVGDNPTGSSLPYQVNKAGMAFKHQRPIEIQLLKGVADSRLLSAEPCRKVAVGNRNDLINVRIVTDHVKRGSRTEKSQVASGESLSHRADQRRGHQRVTDGAGTNNQDSRPAQWTRISRRGFPI